MTNIRPYKEKLVIELKDGTKLYSDKNIDDLQNALEQNSQFMKIDNVLFNKYEFKKAYIEKINNIEDYILSLPKNLQKKVREREKEMKEKVNKNWESIEQIKNYLFNKQNNEN